MQSYADFKKNPFIGILKKYAWSGEERMKAYYCGIHMKYASPGLGRQYSSACGTMVKNHACNFITVDLLLKNNNEFDMQCAVSNTFQIYAFEFIFILRLCQMISSLFCYDEREHSHTRTQT